MRIGDLAKLIGISVEAIRFYERAGLLPAPERTGNNYRAYSATHEEQLLFIRQCRTLDISLGDIRMLLRLRDKPSEDCGAINELVDQHIVNVAQKIQELRDLQQTLRRLRATCDAGKPVSCCGILEGLKHSGIRRTRIPARQDERGNG